MPLTVSIKGVEENIEALRLIKDKTKDKIIEVLQEETQEVVEEAKKMVPVDTGSLRDSIKRTVSKKTLSATVSAGGKVKGVDTYYAFFVEFGTKKMPARPFFYPTARAHEEDIAERLGDEIYELLRRGVGGQ